MCHKEHVNILNICHLRKKILYNNYNQNKAVIMFGNGVIESEVCGSLEYLHCVQRMAHHHTGSSCRQKTKKTHTQEKMSAQKKTERTEGKSV